MIFFLIIIGSFQKNASSSWILPSWIMTVTETSKVMIITSLIAQPLTGTALHLIGLELDLWIACSLPLSSWPIKGQFKSHLNAVIIDAHFLGQQSGFWGWVCVWTVWVQANEGVLWNIDQASAATQLARRGAGGCSGWIRGKTKVNTRRKRLSSSINHVRCRGEGF